VIQSVPSQVHHPSTAPVSTLCQRVLLSTSPYTCTLCPEFYIDPSLVGPANRCTWRSTKKAACRTVLCLLTFFDWYCHFYILCLLRQIFLAADLRNFSRRHSVLMLLSLSSVTNLKLLFGFCAACMQKLCCRTGASRLTQ